MTPEEKAKAYDEALERAKRRYDCNPSDGYVGYANQIIEEIFPQLCESEDERMRKMLIERVRTATEWTIGLRDLILAWLEKQKEQVTDESDKIAAAYQLGRSDERKQKEQKPVEWSEEDESILNNITAYGYLNIDDLEWLKDLPNRFSLRPHWKPSEEQMEELKEASEEMCGYNTFDVLRYPKLKSLFEELNSL